MKNTFFNKILTGLSIGIVVALVPGALLGELMKAISGSFPLALEILTYTKIASSMLAIAIGICVGIQFNFTPIQNTSLAIASLIGSGAVKLVNSQLVLAGTGDVINTAITAAIAALIIIKLGNSLKAYTILLVPIIVIVIAGGIGSILLPYVSYVTYLVGQAVAYVTTLQPILMGMLIAAIFALLIVSPFSTVAIALAIQIGGIASGAANLGIVAAGFGLAVCGSKSNSFATSIAHFLGSPKMQMANFVKKPLMIAPIVANALVLGVLAAIFNIQGTSLSAGFGISGLIGPINAINTGSNLVIVAIVFVVVPVILAYVFNYLFTKVLKLVSAEDYKIDFK